MGQLAFATQAQQRSEEVKSLLRAVHEELEALCSDVARKAFLDAPFGEVDPALVPVPVQEASAIEMPDWLWDFSDSCECSEEDDPMQLRVGLQAQAVLAVLQQSLTVCAAQLREALRQWAFTQNASVQVHRHSTALCEKIAVTEKRIESVILDHEQRTKECEDVTRSLEKAKAEDQELQKKHEALLNNVQFAREEVAKLQEKGNTARMAVNEMKMSCEMMTNANEEVRQKHSAKEALLEAHPAEAVRRLTAAERLMHKAQEQAARTLAELEDIKEEQASFEKAHEVLVKDHADVLSQLEKEKSLQESLVDGRTLMNHELVALAQHYVAVMPDFSVIRPDSVAESHSSKSCTGDRLAVGF